MRISKRLVSQVMSMMGKRGDPEKKAEGARQRMERMSDAERTALAKKAVAAREAKRKGKA